MATATGCSWEDWLALPEAVDGRRHELVDGELVVSPSPGLRHQRVLNLVQTDLTVWAREHGGQVLPGPFDVYVTEGNYYAPDLLYVASERVGLLGERGLPAAPDLVVEISSPHTRRRDLGVKRDRYEQAGVGEYWFVDLDAEQVLLHRRDAEGFGAVAALGRGDVVASVAAPGFNLPVARVLDA